MRYALIANPTAGRGGGAGLADAVCAVMQRGGAACRIAYTDGPGGAESVARRLIDESPQGDGPLCLVACGGDGTVQEVANAIVAAPDCGAMLGLAPGGRCNDFASAFGIRRDARQIAETLLHGAPRAVDLGCVNGRCYCTIATFGFDAAVSRFVNDMRLPLRGAPAYLYGTLRVLARYRPVAARLTLDDTTFDQPVFLTATANTATYGGQMRIAPDADPADGLLDVCVIDPVGRLRVLRLLNKVIQGRHATLPPVHLCRTRRLQIETPDGAQELWADGERIGTTPATIEIRPNAVRVIAP